MLEFFYDVGSPWTYLAFHKIGDVAAEAGVDVELRLPHIGFHRNVGAFSGSLVSPDGRIVSEAEWQANEDNWLPSDDDKAHVKSLQVGVTEPGKMAGWVAPPSTGIHQQPVDFEYVKL